MSSSHQRNFQKRTLRNMQLCRVWNEQANNRYAAKLDEIKKEERQHEHQWRLSFNKILHDCNDETGNHLTDSVLTVADLAENRPRYSYAYPVTARLKSKSALLKLRCPGRDNGELGQYNKSPRAAINSSSDMDMTSDRCRYGIGGRSCVHFPCRVPTSYNFISFQQKHVELFKSYLNSVPMTNDKKRLLELNDVESIMAEAQKHALSADMIKLQPIEKARHLAIKSQLWKEKHWKAMPQDSEIRYGRPIPRRQLTTPLTFKMK